MNDDRIEGFERIIAMFSDFAFFVAVNSMEFLADRVIL